MNAPNPQKPSKSSVPRTTSSSGKLLNSRAFALVTSVLAGDTRFDLDRGASRVMRLMFQDAADGLITPEAFVVHFGPKKQRHPNTYYRRVCPRIVSEILIRAQVQNVSRPLVLGLPASNVLALGNAPTWSYSSRLVWIVPGRGAIKIIVRKSHTDWSAPYAAPIPREGPLAFVELP